MLIALGLALATAAVLAVAPGGGAAEEQPAGSAVMTWARSGGIAGITHTLRIGTGRRAVAVRDGHRATMRLSRKRYARLRALLDEADLASLRRSYPNPGAADTFQYSVGYRGHRVHADETRVPQRLRPALAALSAVFDDVADRQSFQDPRRAALAAARARWKRTACAPTASACASAASAPTRANGA